MDTNTAPIGHNQPTPVFDTKAEHSSLVTMIRDVATKGAEYQLAVTETITKAVRFAYHTHNATHATDLVKALPKEADRLMVISWCETHFPAMTWGKRKAGEGFGLLPSRAMTTDEFTGEKVNDLADWHFKAGEDSPWFMVKMKLGGKEKDNAWYEKYLDGVLDVLKKAGEGATKSGTSVIVLTDTERLDKMRLYNAFQSIRQGTANQATPTTVPGALPSLT